MAQVIWLCATSVCALAALGSLYAVLRTMHGIGTVPMSPPAPAIYPKLSLIIPACNEGETLGAATRAKLASDYPDLEIILVQDRSTDDTAQVADAIAAADPRVRVVHVEHLPAGWLGKVHALDVGVRASSGEWFLLSDADVHLSPTILKRTVAEAEAKQLDYLALIPRLQPSGFVLDVVLSYFMRILLVLGRGWAVSNPKSDAAVGGGSFMAVRRSAYDRTAGFSWLRLEIGDDVVFGQMMKQSGARCAIYNAPDDVRLCFYPTLGQMMRGVEKNGFTMTGRYSIVRHVLVQLTASWLELGPWLAIMMPWPGVRALGIATALVVAFTNVLVARWCQRGLVGALTPGLGALVFVFITSRATLLAIVRGGVSWRGTFYRLEDLRRETRIVLPF